MAPRLRGRREERPGRHFPPDGCSVYLPGHSTGGPLVFMISQRVPNVAGMLAVENSPFGFIHEAQQDWSATWAARGPFAPHHRQARRRTDPFNELYSHLARPRPLRGAGDAGPGGPHALMRLPWLMEDSRRWEKPKTRPRFKADT